MALYRYDFSVPADERQPLARAWLWLAVALGSVPVFSRCCWWALGPWRALLPGVDFFHVALVVHVDLSVLVWFVSIAGLMWSLSGAARWIEVGWAGWALCALGAPTMAAAPFIDWWGAPVMSNYVPVITSRMFLYGLVLFGLGLGIVTLRALAFPVEWA